MCKVIKVQTECMYGACGMDLSSLAQQKSWILRRATNEILKATTGMNSLKIKFNMIVHKIASTVMQSTYALGKKH